MTGPATLSLGRVVFLDDGTWHADPGGAPAVLVPVHDRHGDWVDILAYHLDDPCEWRLRFGDECPILGATALAQAAWDQEYRSGPSVPSPVCILDWGVELGPLFEGVSTVACDSPELHDRLQQALRAWEPEITAPRENRASTSGFRTVRDAA